MRIKYYNNCNFFKSQETINVLHLDFSEINYPFASKFSSKTFKKQKKHCHFLDNLQPLHTNGW